MHNSELADILGNLVHRYVRTSFKSFNLFVHFIQIFLFRISFLSVIFLLQTFNFFFIIYQFFFQFYRVLNLCVKYCNGLIPDTTHDPAFALPFDLDAVVSVNIEMSYFN